MNKLIYKPNITKLNSKEKFCLCPMLLNGVMEYNYNNIIDPPICSCWIFSPYYLFHVYQMIILLDEGNSLDQEPQTHTNTHTHMLIILCNLIIFLAFYF